jgi:hypothetical protein
VDFYYDGAWYSVSGGSVKISVLGSTTTFVRGTWPPRVVNLAADGGPRGKITVRGRVAGGHWVNTDPSLKQTYPKLRPHFKPLIEPNDKSLLGCRIHPPRRLTTARCPLRIGKPSMPTRRIQSSRRDAERLEGDPP